MSFPSLCPSRDAASRQKGEMTSSTRDPRPALPAGSYLRIDFSSVLVHFSDNYGWKVSPDPVTSFWPEIEVRVPNQMSAGA